MTGAAQGILTMRSMVWVCSPRHRFDLLSRTGEDATASSVIAKPTSRARVGEWGHFIASCYGSQRLGCVELTIRHAQPSIYCHRLGPAWAESAIQGAKLGKRVALDDRKSSARLALLYQHGTNSQQTMREAVLHISGYDYQNIYA